MNLVIYILLSSLSFKLVALFINDKDCGKGTHLTTRLRRIVGGSIAKKGDFGWQAVLKVNGNFSCGSTLINDRWLITAAHCMVFSNNPLDYTIDLGVDDLSKPNPWSLLNLKVKKFIVHKLFNLKNYVNDIALIQLEYPIKMDRTQYRIIPICISQTNSNLEGLISVATGFGYQNEKSLTRSEFIRQVTLPIISDSECFKNFNADINTQFCAGNNIKKFNTCRGDSGGPLIVQTHGNQWYLVGITSWGYACGGVYTRLGFYNEWINSIIKQNQYYA